MTNETDIITQAFLQMTLGQAEELAKMKRKKMHLAMNANLSAQLDQDAIARERTREIIGQCLAATRQRRGGKQ